MYLWWRNVCLSRFCEFVMNLSMWAVAFGGRDVYFAKTSCSTWPKKRTSGFVCEFVMNLLMWIYEFVMICKAKRGRNTICTIKGSTWPEKRTIEPASEKQLAWQWCCDNGMEWNPLHSWKVPVTFQINTEKQLTFQIKTSCTMKGSYHLPDKHREAAQKQLAMVLW